MKSAILPAALLAISAVSAAPAYAKIDGNLTFEGTISGTTCTINGSTPGTPVDVPFTLNPIPAYKLQTAGDREGFTTKTITIGGTGEAGCENGTEVWIAFDPTSALIDKATGRLNIDTAQGAAKNVQIEITDHTGKPIHIINETSPKATIAGNTAALVLGAQYYATDAAEKGDVKTRVGFIVAYSK